MIISIQYMRGIAALLVVFSHIAHKVSQHSPNNIYLPSNIGELGVDLFFIISGFIMVYISSVKENNIYDFLTSRFVRIIPLYWILTTAALLVYLYEPSLINSSGGTTSIINSYFLIPDENKFLVQNGWTLSYEFYFYFIFSIGIFISYKNRSTVVTFILIALATYGFYQNSDEFIFNSFLIEFALGIISFQLYSKLPSLRPAYIYSFITISLSGFIFLDTGIRIIDNVLPVFFLFLTILYLEPFFQKNSKFILLKFTEMIGNSSYSLYLLHPFVLSGITIILNKEFIHNHSYLYSFIMLSMSIFLGFLCFKYIETTSSKLLKKIFIKR